MSTQCFPGRSQLILPTPSQLQFGSQKAYLSRSQAWDNVPRLPEGLISLSTSHLKHGCTTASSYLWAQAENIHILL